MAGGVERVLTLKANYFAEHFGYDITVILTEGKGRPLFYPLSDKIKVVHLDINFEELWTCSFLKKIFVYLTKQRRFKRLLTEQLLLLRPDITVSMLRREINFINSIRDGSRKIGELHINRANYRNFDAEGAGWLKRSFAALWSCSLLGHLRQLDKLVVLTDQDREAWHELHNVVTIPNPLSLSPSQVSPMTSKRVLAIARYSHEKGIDLLLRAWATTAQNIPHWRLDVYGDGERAPYEQLISELGIDRSRCQLHGRTDDVEREYCSSSLLVLSSRFEGFGMVMVEAMACGLPVVAFDCPWGPRSIITDGVDGLLADNGNPSDLSRQLLRLMTDESLRLSMSCAAAVNIRRFSISRIAAQWQSLFETVVNNR